MNDKLVVFILTHGRPDNVITYKTLKRCGFTGDIYIIIDNEDKTKDKYIKKFGDKVIIFDKEKISKTFDEADNFNDRRSIVYARNACFEIAKNKKIKYFIQLDDDYTAFNYTENKNCEYTSKSIKNLDKVFEYLLDFYKNTGVNSIAMAQGGDFIGGANSNVFKKKLSRKCMNSFICSNEKPFKFMGRINEDVNIYTKLGSIGFLFFTTSLVRLEQKPTQSNNGGMTDIYLDNGTYVKSFYTIIFSPSSVKISMMGEKNRRLHHRVKWKNAVPQIIREEYKK